MIQQADLLTVIGDKLRMMLDDDNRLAVVLVQLPQHFVDLPGMAGIELGHRLVDDQDLCAERESPGQGEQMLLAAAQLPNVAVL
ncbi:hypothetical protein D3C76_1133960 [compost metagenome]